ncbi:MAG: hypothetical protein ACT4N8_08885 [Sphingosinicella sp.]|uniref:hypothetical protein n=1 Tax=Sphingosinicella sp. TaxID=1917971 RepID=UPI004037D3DE
MARRALSVLMLTGFLAACGGEATQIAGNAAAVSGNEATANEAAPAPEGNAAQGSGPLSVYVGHPTNTPVDGVIFTDHPLVRRAVEAAVSDAAVRGRVLSEGTAAPIALRDGRLVAHACEPHNCGPHNWTILIDPAGTSAEICYAVDSIGERATWYAAGRVAEERPGACPSS